MQKKNLGVSLTRFQPKSDWSGKNWINLSTGLLKEVSCPDHLFKSPAKNYFPAIYVLLHVITAGT